MPQIVLVAINASYSHTNLAVRYLKRIADKNKLAAEIREYTINDQVNRIADELIDIEPHVLAFSCYIWNYEILLKVVERVKLACPATQIIVGGPQMIDCDEEWMKGHPAVDLVITGEGEIPFQNWCKQFCAANNNEILDNLSKSPEVNIIKDYVNQERGVFGQAYTDQDDLSNRLAYYETSRGCAYRCSYCLSSLDKNVRYRAIEEVKNELKQLAFSWVKTVKLVDRTFNMKETRAREIIEYWCSLPSDSCLHCEIVAEIMSDDMIEYLNQIPVGRLQFEIGIQSTNPKSLHAVNRSMNWVRTAQVIRQLLTAENIHIHLDLLVGLPYEDLNSLANSFNDVYSLRPHHLQLGMLKILPGTQMKSQAEAMNYCYVSYPPYEIVSNPWLSARDITVLHQIAETLDKLYNGVDFKVVHDGLIPHFSSPFDYWLQLSHLAWNTGMLQSPQKSDKWAYLPVLLAKSKSEEHLAMLTEERARFSLLRRERRYHFVPPFVDTSLVDSEYYLYRDMLEEKWPGLQGINIKDLKRQVVIHKFPAMAATEGCGETVAFLYSDNGKRLLDYWSW